MKTKTKNARRHWAVAWLCLLCCLGASAPGFAQNITRVEYFFDADPGFGNGTAVPITPGPDLNNLAINPSIAGLADGFHTLSFRTKSTGGWSHTNVRSFFKETIPNLTLANITRVEYFFDTDPGFGNGIAVPVTPATSLNSLSLALDLTPLSVGFHHLQVRARDANGNWSLTHVRTFYKEQLGAAGLANITRVEYFVNTDPGFGSATPISITPGTNLSNLTFALDLTTLPVGFHHLQVRAKDANGNWSLTNERVFYKDEIATTALAAITRVEYFFDTDPGFGNATPVSIAPATDLPNIPLALDLTLLADGFHHLQVRAQNANGNWSLTSNRTFYKEEINTAALPNITRVEYFLDSDPGFGSATAIPISPATDLSNLTLSLDLTAVPVGFHHLQVRARDANGNWSLTNNRSFYKEQLASLALPNITRVEYFVDTDPGFGQGTPVTITPGTDLTNVTFAVDVTALSLGAHKLFTRAQDANGSWAITNISAFDVVTPVPYTTLTTQPIAGTTFCAGDQVLVSFSTNGGAANSSNVFTAQLSNASGSFTAPVNIGTFAGVSSAAINATIPAGAASGSGYRIRVVSSSPAVTGSDNGANLTIGAPPTVAFAGNSQVVCGATASLSANTPTSGTGSWALVSGAGIIASPGNSITTVSNLGLGQNVFRWSITVGSCTPSVSDVTITRNPTPNAPVATNNGPLCPGAMLQLSATTVSGAGYFWSGPAGFTSSAQNPQLFNISTLNEGAYSVTATVNGCPSAAATTTLTVNPSGAAPVATYNGPLCAGQSLQLSVATVAGATSYSWTGPGGFSSAQQNPVVANATVGEAGLYSVYALGSSCASVPGVVAVTIGSAPATPGIFAGGSTALCTGQSVQLTASTAGPYSWSTGQTTQVITVNTAGNYTVQVSNSCGVTSSAPVAVTVNPIPAVSAVAASSGICSGQSTMLTASGADSYFWSPNITLSSAFTPVVSAFPGSTTTYTVTGTTNGCSATASVQVAVSATPVVTATASQSTIISGQSTFLSATGASNYSWLPSAGMSNSTAAVVEVAPTATTTYTLLGTTGGCSAQAFVTVSVNAATYTITATAGANGSISPSGAVAVTNGNDQTFTITPACGFQIGNVLVNGSPQGAISSYTFSNVSGNGTISASFLAYAPVISASGTTALCPGQTVNLTASSGSAYSWSTGATTQVITVSAAGNYAVEVTGAPGCTLPAQAVSVTGLPAPAATITALNATTLCQGETVTLSASGNGAFTWNTGATTATLVTATAGNYTLTAVNSCGTVVSDPVTVTVNPVPTAAVTADGPTTICQGQTVGLTASGNGSFSWSTGETTPVIFVNQSGAYTVTATNSCGSVTSGNLFVNVTALPTATITPGGATTFCQGQSVVLSAAGNGSFSWSNGATLQNLAVTQAGTYTVAVTNSCGTTVSDPVTVIVNPAPVAAITASGTLNFCEGGSVNLTASSGNAYSWSSGQTTQVITATTAGNYHVLVNTGCGTATAAAVAVTVYSAPTVAISSASGQVICSGQSVGLTASQDNNFGLNLNGTNQLVAFTDVLDFGTNDFTIEAWFNADVFPATAEGSKLLNKGLTSSGAPANAGYGLRLINEGGVNKIRFMVAGSTSASADAANLATGTWYHVAAVREGSDLRLYLNGALAATSSTGTVLNLNSNMPLAFGALYRASFGPTSEYYHGKIDEVRFWNLARSAADIAASMNGTPAASPGPAAYWTFNAGAGATVTNATGTTLNGTIQNSAGWVAGAPITGSYLPVSYAWSPGAGLSATSGQVVTAAPGATTAYSVTASNTCGSTTSAAYTVSLSPAPTATITPGGATTFCQGQSVVLSASGGNAYSWSTGATTQNITVFASGTYTVTVANACGTAVSDPVTVIVNPAPATPTITALGATTICAGSTVMLSASPADAYTWSNGATTQTITVANSGNYSVAVWQANGCGSVASAPVAITQVPAVTVSATASPTTLPIGGTVALQVTAPDNSYTYSWTGPHLVTNTGSSVSAVATAAGMYTYLVTASNGTCAQTATLLVTVEPGSAPCTTAMSGNYTINPALATGGTNFQTFADAVSALTNIGVCGPVVINVASGSGPFTSQLLLDSIPGTSTVNLVTFNGNGNAINFCGTAANRDLIRLNGTDNVHLNGFVLNATCNFGWGVHLVGEVSNVTLASNTINLSASQSIFIGSMQGIVATNSAVNPQAPGGRIAGLTVTGNTITNGYYGIRIQTKADSVLATGVTVSNNTVSNAMAGGIDLRNLHNPTVTGNQVAMRTGSGYLSNNSAGLVVLNAENGLTITGNSVHSAGLIGLYLQNINRESSIRGLVANNMIGGNFQNTALVHALQLNAASNLDIYHNSVLADNGAAGSALLVTNQLSRFLNLQNNSLVYQGANGYALQANAANLNFLVIDHNNYHTTGARFVRFSGADRTSLANMQSAPGPAGHNMFSLSANPQYTGPTDLHLTVTSPLIGQAATLTGFSTDFDGDARTLPADIGADEFAVAIRAQAKSLAAEVYPNPFAESVTVVLHSKAAGEAEVVLTDMMGRRVLAQTYSVQTGANNLEVNVGAEVPQGVYLLQVQHRNQTAAFRAVKK